jgi:hypothetical protein
MRKMRIMKTNTKAVYKCGGCEEATLTVELTTENRELQDKFNTQKPTCICGSNIPMYEDSRAVQIVR